VSKKEDLYLMHSVILSHLQFYPGLPVYFHSFAHVFYGMTETAAKLYSKIRGEVVIII